MLLHNLLEHLALCGVLRLLTRQLLLHGLRLRLVVKLRLFAGLTGLLGLSGKVKFLSSLLLRKILRNGLVIHLLLLRALTKNLL